MIRLFLRHTAVVTMTVLLGSMGTRSVAACKVAAVQQASVRTEVSGLADQTDAARVITAIMGAHLEGEEVEEREVAHRNNLLRTDLPTAGHVPLDLATITVRCCGAALGGCAPQGTELPRVLLALLQVLRL